MYRQDKATTEKHTRILRELVKRPENKMCADCKRQDARWASWNIGVFICIRCSGVHRSMGTHISKVKSVDLDTWTPEQMESIQKWGNHRANLYWEAHLRPGHVPAEHKLDSFIRSKYESRRWAREGPPPSDPSVLEHERNIPAASDSVEAPAPVSAISSAPTSPPLVTSRQSQPHRLLSATLANRGSVTQPAVQEAKAPEPQKPTPEPHNDLFSLDFHAPPQSTAQEKEAPKKDVKNDILSLFSTPSPAATPPVNGAFGQWGQVQTTSQAQQQTISMMGSTGTAMWGAQSGWTPNVAPAQPDVWNGFQNVPGQGDSAIVQQSSAQGLFETQSVWGSTNGTASGGSNDLFDSPFGNTGAPVSNTQKKNDVFGDLWGGFK